MSPEDAWARFAAHAADLAHLRALLGLLQWDQQTHMPSTAAAARAGQLALVSRLHHEQLVSPRLEELLHELEGARLSPDRRAGVANLAREAARARRVPAALVAARSEATSTAFAAWLRAREDDDFAPFAPHLARVFALTRETAAAIDDTRAPYDVLLEGFDPGVSLSWLTPTLSRLERGLRGLLDALPEAAGAPPAASLALPLAAQRALHDDVVRRMGFDFGGRGLADAEHPFTVGVAAGDVRLTTHVYEDDLLRGLSGTIHEAGHGLYEQGLPRAWPGAGVDEAASTGLHESQSRFYENVIGRSEAFATWLAGRVRALDPDTALDAPTLLRALRVVRRDPIRVFADEVTYNLHIILRVQLEVALLDGSLPIDELPAAWDDAYEASLGIRPATLRDGCCQDIHWCQGAIGYFPGYTLGNLAAASMRFAMEDDLPTLWDDVAHGELSGVLRWLRDKVHRHGHALEAPRIVQLAVGDRDQVTDLLDHLWDRYGDFHGASRP